MDTLTRGPSRRTRGTSARARGSGDQEKLEKELEAKAAQGECCVSCALVGMHTLRDPKSNGQDTELCNWCSDFEKAHNRRPPRAILRMRREGKRVYQRDVEAALRESA